MDNQRLRNLTTGILHTTMRDIYDDIEFITGIKGISTFQLPFYNMAIKAYLEEKVRDLRFWDGKYDTTHIGDSVIIPMNDNDRVEFNRRLYALF